MNSTRNVTETVEHTTTETGVSYHVTRKVTTWVHPDGTSNEPYKTWEAFTDDGHRLAYGNGHELHTEDRALILKRYAKDQADLAIIPLARAAKLDHGRSFAPWNDRSGLVPVEPGQAKVGDLVWVYSYQVWRRGVVEKVGRTNLTVAVVVVSTGTFSRQSVKPTASSVWAGNVSRADVWWDTLNT